MRTRTFSLYIAATPDQVWRAITEPAQTRRFYLGLADVERDEAWSRVLSGLKTVLETGAAMPG